MRKWDKYTTILDYSSSTAGSGVYLFLKACSFLSLHILSMTWATEGRGLADSAKTSPAQHFKPQAQDRGASPPWSGALSHQTSLCPPPPHTHTHRVPLEPCRHLYTACGSLGGRTVEEERACQESAERGVKRPLSDGRRNFPLLPGGG